MPAATLNAVSFAGTVNDAESVVRAPQKITPSPQKIAELLEAMDGTRNLVYKGSARGQWDLEWQRVPEATRAAVRAIFDLTTTFSATVLGSTVTVQCEPGDYSEDVDTVIPGPTYYFNVKLTIRQ